jgi:hypothetical protein
VKEMKNNERNAWRIKGKKWEIDGRKKKALFCRKEDI